MPQTDLIRAAHLGAKELRRIHQILQFLVGLTTPNVATQAARLGYDNEEHRTAWSLVNKALGSHQPFDHSLAISNAQTTQVEASSGAALAYRLLDEFENLWFPRVRAALLRFLPDEQSDSITANFFGGLVQHRLGPQTAVAVITFVSRYEAFSTSDIPGAAEVTTALAKRGLNDELRRVKALLADAQQLPVSPPMSNVDPAVLEAASEEQRHAFTLLNKWYVDWSTTLRPQLTYHEKLRLGLLSPPRKGLKQAESDAEQGRKDRETHS